MKKQKLTFKVDGGLEKVSALYAAAQNNKQAVENYGQNPASLLQALSVEPSREIRISEGYKKLASTMDTINFGKWHDTFEPRTETTSYTLQQKAFTSLWYAVNGYDPALQAGKMGDDFEQANAVVVVVTFTMTVTMASTNGYSDKFKEIPAYRTPTQDGPKFAGKEELAYMSRYAQTVAEQIGWFS